MDEFSEAARKIINYGRWLGVSRHIIWRRKNKSGQYYVTKMAKGYLPIYFILNLNTILKMCYLAAVLMDCLGPVSFLDKIANLDYFLCGVMVIFGAVIWDDFLHGRICRLLMEENEIFAKFGHPPNMKTEVGLKHRRTIRSNFLVVLMGCTSLAIQFYGDPKNCSWTYSILKRDNAVLRFIFCAHEITFMAHAWFCNAGSSSMVTLMADNLAVTLKRLIEAVRDLEGEKNGSPTPSMRGSKNIGQNKISPEAAMKSSAHMTVKVEPIHKQLSPLPQVKYEYPPTSPPSTRNVFQMSRSKEEGGCYDIDRLPSDYQRLSLATRVFNDGVAYKLAGLILTAYCQYVASTFMAFQVIRNEGGGIGDIWFYLQDCIVSGYQTFRVFSHMSEVLPLANELYFSIQQYEARTGCPMTKEQRRRYRALTKMSMDVGVVSMGKMSVLNSMQSLVSYYLCVALW